MIKQQQIPKSKSARNIKTYDLKTVTLVLPGNGPLFFDSLIGQWFLQQVIHYQDDSKQIVAKRKNIAKLEEYAQQLEKQINQCNTDIKKDKLANQKFDIQIASLEQQLSKRKVKAANISKAYTQLQSIKNGCK